MTKLDGLSSMEIDAAEGKIKINGGINHSGTLITSTITANKVELSDHVTEPANDAPFLRSSLGKRRSATKDTMAGVIITATKMSDKITTSGVIAKMISKGTSTVFRLPMPLFCNQVQTVAIQPKESSDARTKSFAGSQKK